MIGACFRVGEFKIRFPGDFGQVDREAIGDDHDGDIAEIRGADDEFQAVA